MVELSGFAIFTAALRRGGPVLCGCLLLVLAGSLRAADNAQVLRIVSLAPHVTELLYVAGAGDRLVAAVDFSDWPEAARKLPRVGNFARLDIERILALQPDLVVGWKGGNDAGDLERLRRLGLRVHATSSTGVAEIADDIEMLGRLAGTEQAARRAAGELRASLHALEERYASRAPVTVFYQIWDRPLMTVSGRHFISDSLRLCGGRNIFAELEPIAPTVSIEAVIARNPQAIINSASATNQQAQLESWRRWKELDAVRLGNLYSIPPDIIARPGIRILEGIERLCAALDESRHRITRLK
ncbi:MAG: cobalamin-binding protein [Gammaproteobacteria bacterium]|nr:cobalamin-binding protein [Gammaproteobacteria bacterium]